MVPVPLKIPRTKQKRDVLTASQRLKQHATVTEPPEVVAIPALWDLLSFLLNFDSLCHWGLGSLKEDGMERKILQPQRKPLFLKAAFEVKGKGNKKTRVPVQNGKFNLKRTFGSYLERLLCPIFLRQLGPPKTSNYYLKHRALGFPGRFLLKMTRQPHVSATFASCGWKCNGYPRWVA